MRGLLIRVLLYFCNSSKFVFRSNPQSSIVSPYIPLLLLHILARRMKFGIVGYCKLKVQILCKIFVYMLKKQKHFLAY
jgi:hypothetical protein